MARIPTISELGYLRRASTMLELPTATWATGTVLFHRYCAHLSANKCKTDPLPSQISMMLCLYLATKVTEEPRKQRDIINVGFKIAHPESTFLPVSSTTLAALRTTLSQGELVMMRILGFEFNVELPHAWIASILYGMAWWERNGEPPEDTELVDSRIKNIARYTWIVANCCVESGLVDQAPARILGAACIFISMQFCKEELPARDFEEWADIWAKTSGKKLRAVQELVESSIDTFNILNRDTKN
ncbi:hypothetical protein J3B02_000105 [Coemansia erecta]|nr:hypothetical protein J3B02_000105 [Coemansia erecta]KAJ2888230.1 hypothetical protein FB639_000778 [Coemansia asiatica]